MTVISANTAKTILNFETVELKIPANVLKARNNILRIKPMGKGWFTWDALDLRIM